jgi:predicted helicase
VWLGRGVDHSSDEMAPLQSSRDANGLFTLHSLAVNTNRDAWAFNFDDEKLSENIAKTLDVYNSERTRFHSARLKKLTALTSDGKKIKWSSSLKTFLKRNVEGRFEPSDLRAAMYRPFVRESLYFNTLLTHRQGKLRNAFPTREEDGRNPMINVPGPGNRKEFAALASAYIVALDFAFEKAQCFPFYIYDEDGSNRRENITDWALAQFRSRYGNQSISKWDIFHYTYALLHHPEYRARYAANLKRELPRIPYAPDFARYAGIGKKLMDLHIHYEQQPEYPLERTETGKLDWRVQKMKLSKDKTKLVYNSFLTLCGIPAEVYEYTLGNRSALEWIVDQYCVSTDNRSGIVNDPNRQDDPEYIVRLTGQITTVSLETVKLVRELEALQLLPSGSE